MTCKCDGSGEIVTITQKEWPQADGTVIVTSGHSTSLCECRSSLPPREGKARWWGSRTVYEQTVGIPVDDETVSIEVQTEVPVSADGYPVVTRGNRYYPTLVNVELDSRSLTLHSNTARELAARLIEAADAADRCDLPDTDACGHWAPCDCGRKGEA